MFWATCWLNSARNEIELTLYNIGLWPWKKKNEAGVKLCVKYIQMKYFHLKMIMVLSSLELPMKWLHLCLHLLYGFLGVQFKDAWFVRKRVVRYQKRVYGETIVVHSSCVICLSVWCAMELFWIKLPGFYMMLKLLNVVLAQDQIIDNFVFHSIRIKERRRHWRVFYEDRSHATEEEYKSKFTIEWAS